MMEEGGSESGGVKAEAVEEAPKAALTDDVNGSGAELGTKCGNERLN